MVKKSLIFILKIDKPNIKKKQLIKLILINFLKIQLMSLIKGMT